MLVGGDVEYVRLSYFIDTLLADLKAGEFLEIFPRPRKRAIVHVHGKSTSSTIDHRPIAVATDAAAAIQEAHAAPEGLVKGGPAQKLLFVLRKQVGVIIPGIAEAFR